MSKISSKRKTGIHWLTPLRVKKPAPLDGTPTVVACIWP